MPCFSRLPPPWQAQERAFASGSSTWWALSCTPMGTACAWRRTPLREPPLGRRRTCGMRSWATTCGTRAGRSCSRLSLPSWPSVPSLEGRSLCVRSRGRCDSRVERARRWNRCSDTDVECRLRHGRLAYPGWAWTSRAGRVWPGGGDSCRLRPVVRWGSATVDARVVERFSYASSCANSEHLRGGHGTLGWSRYCR
jgi:hypothetical protein